MECIEAMRKEVSYSTIDKIISALTKLKRLFMGPFEAMENYEGQINRLVSLRESKVLAVRVSAQKQSSFYLSPEYRRKLENTYQRKFEGVR